MPVVDLVFTKINANRNKPEKGANLKEGLKVNSGTNITRITKDKFGQLGECLLIDFLYKADYEPDIGSIEIGGEVVFYEKKLTQVSEVKDGNLILKPNAFETVQNAILSAASVESLIISKEIKLPPAVQLPRVQLQPTGESKEEKSKEEAKDEEAVEAKPEESQ